MYHDVTQWGIAAQPSGRWVIRMAVGLGSYGHLAGGLWRGSPRAVGDLVEAFGSPLYGYLGLMLGDRDVATHALADTFIVATGHIGRLRDVDHMPAWLFALASREHERQQRAATSRALPDALGALIAHASGTRLAERAYLALARLDRREREILLLSAAGIDVARALGTTDSAAVELRRGAVRRYREEATLLEFSPDIPLAGLIEAISRSMLGEMPHDRVLYMCLSPDMAGRRPRVRDRAGPFGPDGFPLTEAAPSRADGGRRPGRWIRVRRAA
jgi:DNA-directed RNA polymerase specialized sigma24 family protein